MDAADRWICKLFDAFQKSQHPWGRLGAMNLRLVLLQNLNEVAGTHSPPGHDD